MIKAEKYKYEESFRNDDGSVVHYFVGPKSMTEVDFCSESFYNHLLKIHGRIAFMCLSLTILDNGDGYIQMSPTLEDANGFYDVDWRDLEIGVNYTENDISILLKKARKD